MYSFKGLKISIKISGSNRLNLPKQDRMINEHINDITRNTQKPSYSQHTLRTGHACTSTPHEGEITDIMDILHIIQRAKIY
jgi:hypothetical protein